MDVCVVVAGGSSSRMTVDKLLLPVGGVPMVCRVVEALREAGCREVVVAGRRPPCSVDDCIADDPSLPCRGPARGLATLAETLSGWEGVVVAPGDAGLLDPGIPRFLAEAAEAVGADTASPMWRGGLIDPLTAYTRGDVLARLREACLLKPAASAPCRATDMHRSSRRLLLVGSALLPGSPLSLARLNTPSDLASPRPPAPPSQRLVLVSGAGEYYSALLGALARGSPRAAGEMAAAEAAVYRVAGVALLELHSLIDAERLGWRGRGLDARIAAVGLLLGRGPAPRPHTSL